ncbi:MAG: hypothetical protein AAF989_13895 [Planctomycetota bacterium]
MNLDKEGSRGEFLRLLAEFGEEPAFVRRAKSVDDSWHQLVNRCRHEQEERLHWPRLRFAALRRRVQGDWQRLKKHLQDPSELDRLARLDAEWEPLCVSAQEVPWTDWGALRDFVDSALRFNAAWDRYLNQLDLEKTNQVRRDFNEYFPLEKECAFGGMTGMQPFQPLPMVSRAEVGDLFPLLNVPRLR